MKRLISIILLLSILNGCIVVTTVTIKKYNCVEVEDVPENTTQSIMKKGGQ